MSASLDRFAAHFERLRALADAERARELGELDLEPAERERLRRMLEADAVAEDPLQRAIDDAVAELHARPSERLGPWRLLREIGAGGMGTVFLADRVEGNFRQQVAIKLLRGFPTDEGMRRLRQERQILAGLDHPHIARLLDGGETADGQPWLAIELVDGIGLLDYIAADAPTLGRRLALFDDMLSAVEHAHQRLVIHRDIKPGNVLVTRDGAVKLLDFGIARLVADGGDGRETSTRVFSSGYASPEQLEGRAITTATDIYSLGVLLRVMLTGGTPASTHPTLPIDAELGGIIAKASAGRAEDRYSGVSELRDDLARYRNGHPVRAAALTRMYRLRKFVGRHRWGVAAVVFGACVIAAFVVQLEGERQRARVAEAQAQQAAASSRRDAASARASLEFLTDAFTAAAPGNAMSRQVSVRDLLDAARRNLDQHADPVVARTVQRLLARLYSELGSIAIARDLMRAGLVDAHPADVGEALRLASDYDTWSHLLGAGGDGAGALAAADVAADLRTRFAPDDAVERIRSVRTRAVAHHRNGEDEKAIAQLRTALAAVREQASSPLSLHVDIAQSLSALLATSGEAEAAERVADDALRRVAAERPADSPERVLLLRAKANARGAAGDAAGAETLLREAIALQERVVASGGAHMMELTNDLALMLNDLGRYREAAELLRESDIIMIDAGIEGAADRALSHGNLGGILESAGDYAGALEHYRLARLVFDDGGIGLDHQARRRVARGEARTLGLSGEHARARALLEALREKARRIDGETSGEYAMLTWQLVVVARGMHDPKAGLRELDEAERLWRKLAPEGHPIFLHMRRAHASFAIDRSDLATALRELDAAVAGFEQAESQQPVDLAIARSEYAGALMQAGRHEQARRLMRAALPVLREVLLPGEISRAAAEQTAHRLGGVG